jgi:hypothetical protein
MSERFHPVLVNERYCNAKGPRARGGRLVMVAFFCNNVRLMSFIRVRFPDE